MSVCTVIAILYAGGGGIKGTNCPFNNTKDDCNIHVQTSILAKETKLVDNLEQKFSLKAGRNSKMKPTVYSVAYITALSSLYLHTNVFELNASPFF